MTRMMTMLAVLTAATAGAQDAPKTLAVGTEGFWKPSALLQGWYDFQRTSETTNTFKLRRAEIQVSGEIVPKRFAYAIKIDPARVLDKQADKVSPLQDFFITYLTPWFDVSLGQFKIPVSWEGVNSSSKLLFAERSAVAVQLGDKRDIGLRLAKTFEWFGFLVGLFNGAGQNVLDTNDGKDLGVRVELYPLKGLTVAGVGYMTLFDREDSGVKDRFEGDLRYEAGPFLFQGEYIWAKDGPKDAEVRKQGAYAAVAWTFLDWIQPCVRVGLYDGDTSADHDAFLHYEGGLNVYFKGHEAKLQLDYAFVDFDAKDAKKDLHEVTVAAQVGF